MLFFCLGNFCYSFFFAVKMTSVIVKMVQTNENVNDENVNNEMQDYYVSVCSLAAFIVVMKTICSSILFSISCGFILSSSVCIGYATFNTLSPSQFGFVVIITTLSIAVLILSLTIIREIVFCFLHGCKVHVEK